MGHLELPGEGRGARREQEAVQDEPQGAAHSQRRQGGPGGVLRGIDIGGPSAAPAGEAGPYELRGRKGSVYAKES